MTPCFHCKDWRHRRIVKKHEKTDSCESHTGTHMDALANDDFTSLEGITITEGIPLSTL